MNLKLLRTVLILALIASTAVKYRAIAVRDDYTKNYDFRASVVAELQAKGMHLLENPVKPPKVTSRVIYFQRPGCQRHSVVMPLEFNFESAIWLAKLAPPDYRQTYAYGDLSLANQDRIAIFSEWLKQTALALAGSGRYVPIKLAVLVAEPPDCIISKSIDWRNVWDRRNLVRAKTASKNSEPAQLLAEKL